VFKRWLVNARTHVLSDLFFVRKRCSFDGEMRSNGVHVVALDLQPRPQLALAQPVWFECVWVARKALSEVRDSTRKREQLWHRE
jgi:hypothetical protein